MSPSTPRSDAGSRQYVEERLRRNLKLSLVFELVRIGVFLIAAGGVVATSAIQSETPLVFVGAPAAVAFVVAAVLHQPTLRAVRRDRMILGLIASHEARASTPSRPQRQRRIPENPRSPLEAGEAVFRSEADGFFLDPATAEDLQAFVGRGSLFALIDSTQTALGSRRVERWLTRPSLDSAEIMARQDAAKRLAEDVRTIEKAEQSFGALAGADTGAIPGFLAGPSDAGFAGGPYPLLAVRALLVPLALALAIVMESTAIFAIGVALAVLNHVYLSSNFGDLARTRRSLIDLRACLLAAIAIRKLLSKRKLQAPLLTRIEESLALDEPAKKLVSAGGFLLFHRTGILAQIANWIYLHDPLFLRPCLVLVATHRAAFERKLGALAEIEALVSVARLKGEQPAMVWPRALEADRPQLRVQAGEHPLIPHGTAVPNGLDLSDRTTLLVVTGSNMAGKSTFLKMVASNVLLAQCGAPVRAEAFEWTPLRVLGDINVKDALDDGKSYFFVEVERVKAILDAAIEDKLVLAVIDEMFRGTNSIERTAAGVAVARRLLGTGALVLLATHDLEFTRLESDPAGGARNFHFPDSILDGNLKFSYRIEAGPATGRNALNVLAAKGFPEDVVAMARRLAQGDGLR